LKQQRVAVLAGGFSPEREVSLRSGKACFESLKRQGFTAQLFDLKDLSGLLELFTWKPDVALLAMHGDGGEDGRLQGALDWAGIPYTGSKSAASALCMDKYLTQMCLEKEGLPLAPFMSPRAQCDFKTAREKLGSHELFAKPRNGGSSINSGKILNQSDWDRTIGRGGAWIVEKCLSGREVTVGLLQDSLTAWTVLPILELRSKNAFYDYESKYTDGMTEFLCPAPLAPEETQQLEQFALRAVQACGVRGYARVDFLITATGPSILEINTLPGMTNLSDLPAMAKAAGLSFDELVLKIVSSAQLGA
jgi:D-alanine-D-alanine ligase